MSFAHSKNYWAITLFIVVLIVGSALRLFDLDLRPLHSDEGVNFHFMRDVFKNGYYSYSHENYHGPTYFYLLAAVVRVFGEAEWAIRLSSALPAILILLVPLLTIGWCGIGYVVLSSLLIGISASSVFYARYAIHETLFLLFSCILMVGVFRLLTKPSMLYRYIVFLSAGLLIATKETFIITFFVLGVSVLAIPILRRLAIEEWKRRESWRGPALLTIFLVLLIFTGGFRWSGGMREMFLAVPQWVSRNESDVGHFKPFLYYLKIIFSAEPALFIGLVFSVFAPLLAFLKSLKVKNDNEGAWGLYLSIWAILITLIYSKLNYKTPWLIINLTIPIAFSVAWWTLRLFSKGKLLGSGSAIVFVFLVAFGVYQTVHYTFISPFGNPNPYSYVHTSEGMLEFIEDLESYLDNNPEKRVVIGTHHYWPLPYYLRARSSKIDYRKIEEPAKVADEYAVVLIDNKIEWEESSRSKRYYRLSDVQEAHAYFLR